MKKILLGVLLCMAAACYTKPRPLPYHEGKYLDAPKDQVASFEQELAYAREEDVPSRASEEYGDALEDFEEAKELLREGEDIEEFREKMHDARVHLDRARAQAKKPPEK